MIHSVWALLAVTDWMWSGTGWLADLPAAAVGLVELQQPLGQSDAPQQVLDEALDPDFAALLLSRRHFQEPLDGDDLPAEKAHGSRDCSHVTC